MTLIGKSFRYSANNNHFGNVFFFADQSYVLSNHDYRFVDNI